MTGAEQDLVDLDRLGRLFDDIVVPALIAWAIYLGKAFLIRLANKIGPPPDKPP